jgi:hypothetical protein
MCNLVTLLTSSDNSTDKQQPYQKGMLDLFIAFDKHRYEIGIGVYEIEPTGRSSRELAFCTTSTDDEEPVKLKPRRGAASAVTEFSVY